MNSIDVYCDKEVQIFISRDEEYPVLKFWGNSIDISVWEFNEAKVNRCFDVIAELHDIEDVSGFNEAKKKVLDSIETGYYDGHKLFNGDA